MLKTGKRMLTARAVRGLVRAPPQARGIVPTLAARAVALEVPQGVVDFRYQTHL